MIGFDIVANCDYVYESSYGKLNELIVDVMNKLWIINPKCIVMTILERRCSDDTEIFLDMMRRLDSVSKVEIFILMISMQLTFIVLMVHVRLYLRYDYK